MNWSNPAAETLFCSIPWMFMDQRSYVLPESDEALVIDPNDSQELMDYLVCKSVRKCLILLTHEHYDHISGVNPLRSRFDCEVLCSETCAKNIGNPKKNLAAFFTAFLIHEPKETIVKLEETLDQAYCCTADITYSAAKSMEWKGHRLSFDEMPGHSQGGQIICVDDRWVFTGDSWLRDLTGIARNPGGDPRAYDGITVPYLLSLPGDRIILAGHGNALTAAQMQETLREQLGRGEK